MKNEVSLKQDMTLPSNTVLKAKDWTPNEKASLAEALGQTCAIQRSYGKSPDELKTLVEGFHFVLKDYPIEKVLNGIAEFLRRSPNIPTPFEIRQIIDPIKEPFVPDWSVYDRYKNLLKTEGKYALCDEETAYMRMCEQYSLSKM